MTADQLEEELFLGMLRLSREGAGPLFDLVQVSTELGIEANHRELIAFVNDNHGTFGSKSMMTLKQVRFEISADGIRHAKEIERSRRKPGALERLKSLPVGKGTWEVTKLGLAALFGALAKSYFG